MIQLKVLFAGLVLFVPDHGMYKALLLKGVGGEKHLATLSIASSQVDWTKTSLPPDRWVTSAEGVLAEWKLESLQLPGGSNSSTQMVADTPEIMPVRYGAAKGEKKGVPKAKVKVAATVDLKGGEIRGVLAGKHKYRAGEQAPNDYLDDYYSVYGEFTVESSRGPIVLVVNGRNVQLKPYLSGSQQGNKISIASLPEDPHHPHEPPPDYDPKRGKVFFPHFKSVSAVLEGGHFAPYVIERTERDVDPAECRVLRIEESQSR